MIRSMTGYAQAKGQLDSTTLSVTIRALNHRYLDVQFRLPQDFDAIEADLRKTLKTLVRRGHVEVQFRLEQDGSRDVQVDDALLGALVEAHNRLGRELKIDSKPDLAAFFRLPGVLRTAAAPLAEEDLASLHGLAGRLFEEALKTLNGMREVEGRALQAELEQRLDLLRKNRKRLAELCKDALPDRQRQLQGRLQELLGDATIDPVRLAEEAAYRAERADVSEELTRLESHFQQFYELTGSTSEVGKRLDFLLQEMNRETNTILSKAPGLGENGLEMTRLALEMKAEIERLREQVQNVE